MQIETCVHKESQCNSTTRHNNYYSENFQKRPRSNFANKRSRFLLLTAERRQNSQVCILWSSSKTIIGHNKRLIKTLDFNKFMYVTAKRYLTTRMQLVIYIKAAKW